MSHPKARNWAYSLPAAMLLMAPFDLLASLAMDAYLPVIPSMAAILATSPEVVQLTLSLYMIVLGVGQIAFGPLSDRIGRRPVLLGGGFCYAAASFGLAAAQTGWLFVCLRILQGCGAAAMLVATFATVRDVYGTRPESITIYGLFSAMLAFVPALGPVAGALTAAYLGWQAIFVALGLMAGGALIHALARWHETRPATARTARLSVAGILGHGAFWRYTGGFATAMGAFFVFFSTAPRILIVRGGLSQVAFSIAFATVALVMIAAAHGLKDRIGRWGIPGSLARGMALLLLGALLLAGSDILSAPHWWSILPPMWVMAVGIVLSVSVTANGALAAFPDAAGTATALYYCLQSLIVGVVGTACILLLPGDTVWPLVVYAGLMGGLTLGWVMLKG